MKNRTVLALTAALLGVSINASAAYDSSWYQTELWSGEYPAGFSVVEKKVVVPARPAMNKDLEPILKCELPYLGVFHPWNRTRNITSRVRYFTSSKIVPLVVRQDFFFEPGDGSKVHFRKGDMIEYLVYLAEGSFQVRINGTVYRADQSLFDKVEDVPSEAFIEELWLELRCGDGRRAWIFLPELYSTDADGKTVYLPGLAGVGPAIETYGRSRDLTEWEAFQLAYPNRAGGHPLVGPSPLHFGN